MLATDGSWQARETNVLADDLYNGTTTDLRRPLLSEAGTAVEILDEPLTRLVAAEGPPVRVTDVLPAREVWRSPSGRLLVDFGQNVVGVTRLTVRGLPAGTQITVRHAEVLEHGELGTRPLRNAAATDTHITSGAAEDVLEPRFTFHGFRYARSTGSTTSPPPTSRRS